jgi:hypothetical protein
LESRRRIEAEEVRLAAEWSTEGVDGPFDLRILLIFVVKVAEYLNTSGVVPSNA